MSAAAPEPTPQLTGLSDPAPAQPHPPPAGSGITMVSLKEDTSAAAGLAGLVPPEGARIPPVPAAPPPLRPPGSGSTTIFAPGDVLAGRYRIVGLLGAGGMGQVYRADDLTLGQPVALKFLPDRRASDARWLERFHNEVRIARAVTHPNVCRVHDIGQVNGRTYLSMEFVDGEDLGALLRKVGRLTPERGLEIARQLCTGLAAAHAQGVLHRDLKPGNIMIDARGRVKITDFGLAATEEQVRDGQAGGGTPAYMAPEQWTGRGSSVQSDIYALGLILYELFSGRRAFEAGSALEYARLHKDEAPEHLSSLISGIDPLIEAAVMRCLEKEPRRRPASALAVLAGLPGGDPLAAALAAGETPTPEMVAAAGDPEECRSCRMVGIAAAGLPLAAAAVLALSGWTFLIPRVDPPKPPEVLAEKASELLARIGHGADHADAARGFEVDLDGLDALRRRSPDAADAPRVGSSSDPLLWFWYRRSPVPMASAQPARSVSWEDPPQRIPGMAAVLLSPEGRLAGLTVVPPAEAPPGPHPEPDWSPLLEAAGFDPKALEPVEPRRTPTVFADRRAAWVLPAGPDGAPVRIEAGSFAGKPVSFAVQPDRPGACEPSELLRRRCLGCAAEMFARLIDAAVLLGGGVLAWRNLRTGRGDRRGALKLAVAVGLLQLAAFALDGHYPPSAAELVQFAGIRVAASLYAGALAWLFYVGVEPYVRRIWPEVLIAWSRLLSGRVHDPYVGREVLVGGLSGLIVLLVWQADSLVAAAVVGGEVVPKSIPEAGMALDGGRHALALGLRDAGFAIRYGLTYLVLALLMRVTLRSHRAAAGGVAATLLATFALQGAHPVWSWVVFIPAAVTIAWVMLRVGLLAMMTGTLFFFLFETFPATLNPSDWYAGVGWLGPVTAGALSAFAYHSVHYPSRRGHGFWASSSTA